MTDTPLIDVYADFETFFDSKYSLKKMPTLEYVRDERFQMLGCAVAEGDAPSRWLTPKQFAGWVNRTDWSQVRLIAHNMLFDGLILHEHYGVQPARYACTQALLRATLPFLASVSLKNASEALGVGVKGDALVAGSDVVSQDLMDYACNDNDLCRRIYQLLWPALPEQEREVMSLTLRWGCVGRLGLDTERLEVAVRVARAEREARIEASGVGEKVLNSNPQFAALLTSMGIRVPTKISKKTEQPTEAFGKNDPEFLQLMVDYPDHRALWEGRLAAKSNIDVNRAEKLHRVSTMLTGTLPMQLNYYGAHTGRWSGSGGLNCQNLPRGSELRRSIIAPPGKAIVVIDSSQIELRLNLWFCGQLDRLGLLRQGGDLYRQEAAEQFGILPGEVTKQQRQFGKVVQLGLGYGMGWRTFQAYCAGGPLGMDPIYLDETEADRIVTSYRERHPFVRGMWKTLQEALSRIISKKPEHCVPAEIGPVTLRSKEVRLPNGMDLLYPDLTNNENGGYEFGVEGKVKYVYGAKLLENIIQALARVVVAEQILQLDAEFETVSSTHDEALFLADEVQAEEALARGLEIFSRSPAWAPDLPLSAEGGYSTCYSK